MSTGRLTLIALVLTGLFLALLLGINATKKDEPKVQPPAQAVVQPVVPPTVPPTVVPPPAEQPAVVQPPVVRSAPTVSAPTRAPQAAKSAPRASVPARTAPATAPASVESPFPKHDNPGAAPGTEVLPQPKVAAEAPVPPRPVYVPPPPPPRPTTAVLPAGTPLDVRLMEAVSSGTDSLGDTFEAQLERDLAVDGKILAKRGSTVIGKISDVAGSGRVKGRARMSVTLTEIKAGSESYPIQTTEVSFEAKSSTTKDAVKVGGAAGLGAIIGAIAGGAKGAAIGAVIGGGAGTAGVIATKGEEVELTPEQRLSFTLDRQVQMKIQSSKDEDSTSRDVSPAGSQDNIQKRVEAKVKKFHSLMPGWTARGGDSSRIQPIMQEFQRRVEAGDPQGAEEKIDEALAIIQKN